jgi:hypothetical protein
MPRSLACLEAEGEVFFYGTPLYSGELEPQLLPNGRRIWALRPSIPLNADFTHNRFVADAEKPVVCVTELARMAIFRSLGHQSHHENLPQRQRRHGWRYEHDEPIYFATAALIANVRKLGKLPVPLTSRVMTVAKTAAPFQMLERERHQFRATGPVRINGVYDVSAGDWPVEVEVCDPYPKEFDFSPFAPYIPELDDYLDELLNDPMPA